jgi:hypothetical protein
MTQAASAANQNLIYLTARCSFPNIIDPQTRVNDKGEPVSSYNCDLILPPSDPGFAKFMQTYAAMATEKWKENAQAAMQRIQMDRKTRCYGQGAEKVSAKTFQVHPGYQDMVFISARNPRQPQIIDVDGKPVDPTNTMLIRAVAAKVYGGCYVNVVIKPWLQQNAQGIGVRCDLVAIQFARDGEPFGAAPADVTGMFGQVAGAAPAPVAPPAAMPAAPFPGAGIGAAPLGVPNFLGG